jgi:hypothetical protein
MFSCCCRRKTENIVLDSVAPTEPVAPTGPKGCTGPNCQGLNGCVNKLLFRQGVTGPSGPTGTHVPSGPSGPSGCAAGKCMCPYGCANIRLDNVLVPRKMLCSCVGASGPTGPANNVVEDVSGATIFRDVSGNLVK